MAKILSFLCFFFHPVALTIDLMVLLMWLAIGLIGTPASSGRPYTWATPAALLVVLLTLFLLGRWSGWLAERERARKIRDGVADLAQTIRGVAGGADTASALDSVGGMQGAALTPHQQRVVGERGDLEIKVAALAKFIGTPIFVGLPEVERMRLYVQHRVMTEYSTILHERIEAFGSAA